MNTNYNISFVRRIAVAVSLAFALPGALLISQAAQARPHHGWMHRHPNATAAAAGVGAYAVAKHSHHGWMHRHPVLTGVGAAAVAHHYAKHHHSAGNGR